MAPLALTSTSTAHAELLLGHLEEVWHDVPRVEREIDAWDLLDQLAWTEEWPAHDQRLAELQELARAGRLTLRQRRRLGRLLAQVRRYEPVVQRLLAS